MRIFALVIAGVIKVDFIGFSFFNFIGAVAWLFSLSGIGYFLVGIFPGITNYMGYIFVALIIITALPIIRMFFKKK